MAEPLCILTAGKVLMLAISTFSLSWTHSVEKTSWTEEWQLADGQLQLVEARVQGSGAGMDPPEGSVRTPDGWTYVPHVRPLKELVLASSGVTASPWRLCTPDGTCIGLGKTESEPTVLWPGDDAGCDRKP